VFDQRANEDEALCRWKVQLEQIEKILAGPNCDTSTSYARRLIEQRQHLELKIAELQRVREARLPGTSSGTQNRGHTETFLASPGAARDILKDGERCDTIIRELRKISHMVRGGGRTVSELRHEFPGLKVWELADGLSEEDRDTFNHPNRWGPAVGYAKNLLAKDYGVSPATVNNWVKAYRRETPSKRVKRQKPSRFNTRQPTSK
jgi:DNA-binding transcriptional MerR regulator